MILLVTTWPDVATVLVETIGMVALVYLVTRR
jgi:hypothetical protein